MSDKVSDEMLMAFVDGELQAEAAAEVARAIAADPALARRADAFRSSRGLARGAFTPVMAEPVPDRLVDAIMQGHPGEGAAARRPRLWRSALPLAASVALAAGIGGYLMGRAAAPTRPRCSAGRHWRKPSGQPRRVSSALSGSPAATST